MNYSDLEADILRLVVGATEGGARVFGEETVTRLVRPELLGGATEDELTEDARTALGDACANILTISAAELQDKLATIYDGILVDDDLDTGVLTVISALAHWQSYLEHHRRGELYELAIRSIEDIDHEVSADLDDFLATPEMAAEHERIRRLLEPAAGAAAPDPLHAVQESSP
ncbi:hypothetical protein AB0G32_39125 [Streptomyces sp. NPDC023723]|uniref:hypothetical protein n=1 Tax=Streptomyces sp. NPDC023723 TaxID=3154323 RepID=UPI0033DCA68C